MDANSLVRGLAAIGAGIAVLAAVGPGISEGMCAASAVSSVGRNPDAYKKIRSTMLLGCALTETSAFMVSFADFTFAFPTSAVP